MTPPTPPNLAQQQAGDAFARLAALVATLRGPDGCPWDRAQTRDSVSPYLVEETYEVMDAIQDGNSAELKEELGDLLFQVLFHADMSEEAGDFDLSAVIDSVYRKMVYRHPHVFGDEVAETSEEVLKNWEKLKAREPSKQSRKSILDGIPRTLPALARAQKISKKAAKVGFEWDQIEAVWAQVHEELDELREALDQGDHAAAEGELGDVLFSLVNLGRKLEMETETALTGTIQRFYNRFSHMEQHANMPLESLTLDQWTALWAAAKDATN